MAAGTEVEKLILAIETVGYKRATTELNKLKKAAKETATQATNVNDQTKKAIPLFKGYRGATSALTNTTGQLSVQLQDIAVQAQSGTDYIRIFAQQGPQIASIFGPGGAVFGAIIAFGALIAGPFISSLFGASERLKELAEKAEELGVSLRKTMPATFFGRLDELTEKYTEVTTELNKELAVRRKLDEQITAEAQSRSTSDATLKRLMERHLEVSLSIEELQLAQKEAIKDINDFTTATTDSEDKLKDMNDAIDAYIRRQELMSKTKSMSIPMRMLAEAQAFAVQTGRELTKEEEKKIILAGVRLQQIEDEKKAQQEANKLAAETARVQQQIAREQERQQEALKKAESDLQKAFEDDRNKAIAELRQAGLLEEERLQDLSYQRQLDKLKLFLAQKRISEEEFSEAKKQLDKKTQDAAIKTAADGLQALGKYNKTAFEAHKAYASGKAIMDTYAGATKAMAEIPFPFNLIAAAGVVAMGLANVATIQSQQYQGRALGGQVRGGQTYVVGERGPELLTMGGNGTVTPNEKLRGATGTQSVSETVNINFQITANDASGFDQLLVARRGMIVSMINQAMNNRGRRGLV